MQNALATNQRIGLPRRIYFLARVCSLCLNVSTDPQNLHVAQHMLSARTTSRRGACALQLPDLLSIPATKVRSICR